MARRNEGEASFEFDGVTWRLRFDMNTLADFQEHTGKDVEAALKAMETGEVNAVDLRVLFWAALREYQPEVTLRDAGRMALAGMSAFHAASSSAVITGDLAELDPDAEKMKAVPSRTA